MDSTEPVSDKAARWRLTLGRLWSRKLDEVIALTTACAGATAEGDDKPPNAATVPSRRLRDRADAACEELGDLAEAIAKIEGGTYGRCDGCGRLMADDWLARDPAIRSCQTCLIDAFLSPISTGSRTAGRQPSVPRQRAG